MNTGEVSFSREITYLEKLKILANRTWKFNHLVDSSLVEEMINHITSVPEKTMITADSMYLNAINAPILPFPGYDLTFEEFQKKVDATTEIVCGRSGAKAFRK